MQDSIFSSTMADMTRPQLMEFIEKNPDSVVLLPLGVIEAHGPHICLGTDIYSAHTYCKYISQKLSMRSYASIIAPPFYWGMNKASEAFTGSFNSREEIVAECVCDIVSSLGRFGFKNIYGLNSHGDPAQHRACIRAFELAHERHGLTGASYILNPLVPRPEEYGLRGDEKFILPLMPKTVKTCWSQYDSDEMHAGGRETAVMLAHHPRLVDVEMAETLPPVTLTNEQRKEWVNGVNTMETTPDIYVGAPADYKYHDAMVQTHDLAARVTDAIVSRL